MLEESEEDRTLRELFNLFDVNGNGVLEKEELREAFLHFTGHACSDEELERLEATADIDGDRQISFHDFAVFCRIAKFTLEFGVPGRLSYGALTWTAPISTSSSQRELWIKFCCGAVAGGISRTAVAPLERLKILLQTNTAGSDASQGTFRALARMWRAEGLQGLFRGNGVNVLRVAPASAVQFMANDEFKRLWAAVKGGSAADVDALTFSERVLAGSFAGALSSALTYPADLLRAKLTVERGASHSSLAAIAAATFRTEGVRGFYKGMVPTIVGVMPYVGFDLAVYSMIKQHVLVPYRREDGSVPTIYTLAAGGTAGAVAQTVAFPFDVVRRRMQVSTFVPNSPQYSGIFDAFRKIWKGEGYLGFSRGLAANYFKVVPSMAIAFWAYETSTAHARKYF